MSFFTALADAYGGYGAGKQQRFQDTQQQEQTRQQQEQLQQQQQQTDIESQKWREQQREILQNKGINPDTNQPYVMPQSLTNVSGGLPNKGHTTIQQLIDWHNARAHYYRSTGQLDNATGEENQALNYQGILGQQGSSLATLQREMMLRQYDNNNPTPLQQLQLQWGAQYGPPGFVREEKWLQGHGYPAYVPGQAAGANAASASEGKLVGQYSNEATSAFSDFQRALTAGKTVPKGPDGDTIFDPKTQTELGAPLSGQQTDQIDQLRGQLDAQKDPIKYAQAYLQGRGLDKVQAPPPGKPPSSEFAFANTVRLYAIYRAKVLQRDAERNKYVNVLKNPPQPQQQQQPGGSYAPQDPQYPR